MTTVSFIHNFSHSNSQNNHSNQKKCQTVVKMDEENCYQQDVIRPQLKVVVLDIGSRADWHGHWLFLPEMRITGSTEICASAHLVWLECWTVLGVTLTGTLKNMKTSATGARGGHPSGLQYMMVQSFRYLHSLKRVQPLRQPKACMVGKGCKPLNSPRPSSRASFHPLATRGAFAWLMPQYHSASCLVNINDHFPSATNWPIKLHITKKSLWSRRCTRSCDAPPKSLHHAGSTKQALWLVGSRGQHWGQDPQLRDGLQHDWLVEFYCLKGVGAIDKARFLP